MKMMPLLLLFLLSACKMTDKTTFPDTFQPSPGKGVVIGTITFVGDRPVNDIYRFFYSPVSGDKRFIKRNSGKILVKAREKNVSSFNGDYNDSKTYLFIIEAEPGEYAFNQYNYLDHIGYSGMVSFSEKFSIPFRIHAEKITYIGELSYNDLVQKGSPRIVVSDKMDRDLPWFKTKYPDVKWDTASNNTVKTGDTANGLIEFAQ